MSSKCIVLAALCCVAACQAGASPGKPSSVSLVVSSGEPSTAAKNLLREASGGLEARAKAAGYMLIEVGEQKLPVAVDDHVLGLNATLDGAAVLKALARTDLSSGVVDVSSLPQEAQQALDRQVSDLMFQQAGTILQPGAKVGIGALVQVTVESNGRRIPLWAPLGNEKSGDLPALATKPEISGAKPPQSRTPVFDGVRFVFPGDGEARFSFSEGVKSSSLYRSELAAGAMLAIADLAKRIDETGKAAAVEMEARLRDILNEALGNQPIAKGSTYASLPPNIRAAFEKCAASDYKAMGFGSAAECLDAMETGTVIGSRVTTQMTVHLDGSGNVSMPIGPPIR